MHMTEETAAEEKFACPSCGRKFAWRPQIAGKAAKCKCGSAVQVPAEAPSAATARPSTTADAEVDPFDALAAAAAEGDEYAVKEEAGYRCPGCGKSMEQGSVVCIYCGFNTKTGKRMKISTGDDDASAPAKAAPKSSRAPAFPPGGHPRAEAQPEGAGAAAMVKPALIFLAVVIVVGGAVYGFKQLGGGGAAGASSHPIDREVEGFFGSGGHEVKAWLGDNSRQQRMVMGMNERQAEAYADRLYNMGAKKVLAFGAMMTTVIAVELPAEPEKRKALFKYQADWHEPMMVPIQKDEGQKYILLRMKLVR